MPGRISFHRGVTLECCLDCFFNVSSAQVRIKWLYFRFENSVQRADTASRDTWTLYYSSRSSNWRKAERRTHSSINWGTVKFKFAVDQLISGIISTSSPTTSPSTRSYRGLLSKYGFFQFSPPWGAVFQRILIWYELVLYIDIYRIGWNK